MKTFIYWFLLVIGVIGICAGSDIYSTNAGRGLGLMIFAAVCLNVAYTKWIDMD